MGYTRALGYAAAIATALTLVGCNGADDQDKEAPTRSYDVALDNPTGRYQIIPSPDDGQGVYVLDTRTGSVRYCHQTSKALGMGCGDNTPTF